MLRKVILALVWTLLSGGAYAGPITFAFTGEIDNDPFGVFGSAQFTGGYTFDSSMTQILNTPQSGGYAGSGGIFNMNVAFAGTLDPSVAGPYSADTLNITVNNNFPGPLDQYFVTGTSSIDPGLSIEIHLDDFSGTAFSNTLLPLTPPSLAAFTSLRFALFAGDVNNPIEAEGVLLSLRCTAGCSTVPEPDTILLFGIALAAFGLARRRDALAKFRHSNPTRKASSAAPCKRASLPIHLTFQIKEMIMRKTVRLLSLLAGFVLLVGGSLSAWAIDGTILIDQNKAMAGNVTPGDASGFPVTITLPGSYKLASNLTVPNADTSGIVVAPNTPGVTIDLNGFAIIGPTTCSGFPIACTPMGSGIGVESHDNGSIGTTVRNGTVRGMGSYGLYLAVSGSAAENMFIYNNGGDGLLIELGLADHNRIIKNGGNGISGGNSVITYNFVSGNRFVGITVNDSLVTNNAMIVNGSLGLSASNTGFATNEFSSNNGGFANPQYSGRTSIGTNACDGNIC